MAQFVRPKEYGGKSGNHVIDVIFPIAVLFVFAASALIVLMLSSNIYNATNSVTDDNYSSRTAFAYVSEKLRQHDEVGATIACETSSFSDDGDSDCLVLRSDLTTTYIYMYDGMLKELRVRNEANASADAGTNITSIKDFAVRSKGSLIFIDITAIDGIEYSLVSSKKSFGSAD